MLWILCTMMLAFANGDREIANPTPTTAIEIDQASLAECGEMINANSAVAGCDASGGSIQWFSWLVVLTLIAVSRERTPEAQRRLSRVRIKDKNNL